MIRYLVWLCVSVGAVLSMGGCHYSEEDSWKICCLLHIVRDEAPSPAGHKTIIDWQRLTLFAGDGSASDGNDTNLPGSWKKRRIEWEVSDFLVRNPAARGADYFVELGMTCRPGTVSQEAVTRCEIEMQIWAECWSKNIFFPGGAPVPEGLRKPFPALLRVRVDELGSTVREPFTQVLPIPGGRLCHR